MGWSSILWRVEFRLLGSVEAILATGITADIGPAKQRCVLAALLMDAGRAVPIETLVDRVWGESPPNSVRESLYSYVARLRRILFSAGDSGSASLSRAAGGYLLAVDADRIDVHRFRTLVESSRLSDVDQAATGLRSALALWRGPALADLPGEWAARIRDTLHQQRVAAMTLLGEVELHRGKSATLLTELTEWVTEYPLVEPLAGHLMVALYRAGRGAESLAIYERTRRHLVETLGEDPGTDLQALHQKILRRDPELTPPTTIQPIQLARIVRPQQLPADVRHFTGRDEQVQHLRERLFAEYDDPVRVWAIAGPGGVGKSALAVRVAHSVRHRFPDGQLYANLHGTQSHPVEPADVLGRFLRALGVPTTDLPPSLDERAARYRDLLADRRVLVMLDDAADEAQVRHLLPGIGESRVLITSRYRLNGLLDMELVMLDVLDADRAVDLLSRAIGIDRAGAEPAAAIQIATLCGGLPLALRIAGARLAVRPHWRLQTLVDRLADQHRVLDELHHGDLEVRASLAASEMALDDRARSLFLRLGLLEIPDFTTWIPAALLDCPSSDASDLVEQLVDANLVDPIGVDGIGQPRYSLHDLTRVYAQERALEILDESVRHNAIARAIGGYLSLTEVATGSIGELPLHGTAPRRPVEDVSDLALADPIPWFDSERASVAGIIRQAAELGWSEFAWDLASSSRYLYELRDDYDINWRQAFTDTLSTCQLTGNRRGEAVILDGLAGMYSQYSQERHQEATSFLERAHELFTELGDAQGASRVLRKLANQDRLAGRFSSALTRYARLANTFGELGDLPEQALCLRHIGQIHLLLHQYDVAVRYLRDALEKMLNARNQTGEATVNLWLGFAELQQGHIDRAEDRFTTLSKVTDQLGSLVGRAYCLHGLGNVAWQRRDYATAVRLLSDAVDTARTSKERVLEAHTLLSMGRLHLDINRCEEAITYLHQCIDVCGVANTLHYKALALHALGAAHECHGDEDSAARAWAEALVLFESMDVDTIPEMRQCQGHLARLGLRR